jgi:hypothetical protein
MNSSAFLTLFRGPSICWRCAYSFAQNAPRYSRLGQDGWEWERPLWGCECGTPSIAKGSWPYSRRTVDMAPTLARRFLLDGGRTRTKHDADGIRVLDKRELAGLRSTLRRSWAAIRSLPTTVRGKGASSFLAKGYVSLQQALGFPHSRACENERLLPLPAPAFRDYCWLRNELNPQAVQKRLLAFRIPLRQQRFAHFSEPVLHGWKTLVGSCAISG